jgi:hypothetical protein
MFVVALVLLGVAPLAGSGVFAVEVPAGSWRPVALAAPTLFTLGARAMELGLVLGEPESDALD